MKKLLVLFVAGILTASSSASAQCTSCAGSAPSFQSVPYASAPVYSGGGYMGQPMNYGAAVSYSSAPVYAQPMVSQPVYSQPAYSQPCCSQPVYSQPMYQGGCCGQSYGTPVSYAQPMAYSSYPSSPGCGACAGSNMVYGQGNVIYQNPTVGVVGGNVDGVIAAPMDATPAPNSTQPPAPATGNPPAPEETGTDSTPAPEEKKDGET